MSTDEAAAPTAERVERHDGEQQPADAGARAATGISQLQRHCVELQRLREAARRSGGCAREGDQRHSDYD